MAHYPPNNHYLSVTTKEESYAPKSPDLSATFDDFDAVDTPHPQHQQYRGSVSHFAPYTPTTEPTRSPWGSVSQQGGLPYGQVQQQQPQGHGGYFPPQPQQQQQPLLQNPYYSPHQAQAYLPTGPSMVKQEDGDYIPGGGGRPQRMKAEGGGPAGFGTATTSNGFALTDIEVKTKFPIARIKRIMQADEDVGKVAQVTPVVVSKALELFMISLVTKAATQAKARNSKRVLASHLKEAVMADEQFDFLNEIVAKVADAPTAASKKEEPDSDENEGGAPAKRKRAPRKKRKDSDEF